MSLNRTITTLQRRKDEDRGFTLIELLIVIGIIAILVAIAIPVFLNIRTSAFNRAIQSDVRAAVPTVEQYYSDKGAYPTADVTSATGKLTIDADHTSNVTGNDTLVYHALTTSTYTITGTSSNANTKTYVYTSSTGKTVEQ
jgi:type IV pilus assembly protein PilA